MLYRYCIVDHHGHESRGELEAEDREQALRCVGRDDRAVTELDPVGPPTSATPHPRPSFAALAAPAHQQDRRADRFRAWLAAVGEVLAAQHARTLPDAIWQVTGEQAPYSIRRAADTILDALLAGRTLSDALPTLNMLSPLECHRIEIAEDQGSLPKALRKLCTFAYSDRAHPPLSRIPHRPPADQPLVKMLWMMLREAHQLQIEELFIGQSCDGSAIYFGIGDDGEEVALQSPPAGAMVPLHRILLQYAEIPYWAAYIRYGRFRLDPREHDWMVRAQPNLLRLHRLSPTD